MSILSQRHFHDEEAAFQRLEEIIWPNGPVCPHCGNTERIYALKGVRSKPSKKNPEGVIRHGLKKCGKCRKQFTVRVGTLFESSHVPLHKWFQAVHLMCSSKKGVSAHQLHRILQITYEAAWFVGHRIREAMRTGDLAPMGGNGSIAEADETFIGNKKGAEKKRGYGHKMAVLSLVERGSVHTNTLEGYFSIFKRGIKGVYQHVSEKHLHRYLAEFDFRYNNRIAVGVDDEGRSHKALRGIVGKRLTYRGSSEVGACRTM